MERMSDDEYAFVQNELARIGGEVENLDLVGFLERIETAESVGPVLNPTLYMRGARTMEWFRGLALAVRKVKAACAAKERLW